MLSSVPRRRSDRLKNVQSNQSKISGNLNTMEQEEIKSYCKKRARPRNLVSREQPLQHHEANQNSEQTGKIGDFSSFNQEKNMPFLHTPRRKRRFIPEVENNTAMLEGEHVQTSSVVKQNFDVISGPSSQPVWSGSICACRGNFGLVDGLAAYISSKAGAKVSEMAKLLPPLLHAEMLPRLDVWPSCYDTCPPTDDIIDLCILPMHQESEKGFDNLLNEMTGKDIVLKAVLDNMAILVFSSLQFTYQYWRTTSGKYYLWVVFVGKDAFPLQDQEKNKFICNFDCTMRSNLANEVHPVAECQRSNSKHGVSEEDRRMMEKVKTILMNNGSTFLSEGPCALDKKSPEEQQTGRAVNEGLTEEGISGTVANSIRDEIDTRERTSIDKHAENTIKEVIGEETDRKNPPTISKSLRPNVEETSTAFGFPEIQPNSAVEECLGDGTYGLDQSAVEGIGTSCCHPMVDSLEAGKVSGVPSLANLHETVQNSPVLQLYSEEQGECSPERASSESIGASVFHMACTFDDQTSLDEVSSVDVPTEQVDSYSVKPRYAPVLRAIMDKHGDIARDFPIRCSKMLTFALESVCEAVQDLDAVQFINLRKSHLESLHSAITDAELVKLDVKWLQNRYEELVKAVDQIKEYKNLKDMRKKMNKIAAFKKKVLSSKKAEMSKLQSEMEILEKEVARAAAKSESLSFAISNVTSKCKHFCRNSLMDGLL